MTAKVAGGVTVDACENGCGGLWFDAHELSKVNEQHEGAGTSLLEVARRSGTPRHAEASKLPCPRCSPRTPMMRHFSSAARRVEVDECPRCGGHWLDLGELASLRTEYATDAERKRAARAYFAEIFDPKLKPMRDESQAKLAQARKVAHTLRFLCPSYYLPGKQSWGAF
jgi:Zn-finger nucleic acid-binding protein